ncbi:hypothetical protein LRY65_04055 [Candidatus Woesebacteria bacterium]|nr:hypothetical protein [Candidatus Woesebacteria bacterium]MCD8527353.1 hypothetical protein [Candidatus Woesebacteria bacterium]MCD8546100.1 hypothetical protein [Candidatus Woesebacteria bacterium]
MARSIQDIDFVLLDSYSLLFRAFYAFPLSLTSPDGELTNATFGFTKLLLDMMQKIHPDYLVAAIDMGEPTFRHEAFVDYKANREEAPNELKQQIKFMQQILEVLNVPTLGFVGYEADDVIGTIATDLREEHPDKNVGIFTGDRDSFQLVGESVYVIMPATGRGRSGLDLVDSERVIDKFSVRPDQVVDYKALCGDASDNIPGVKGVGPKTAAQLLHEFGTLQRIYLGLALAANQQEVLDAFKVTLDEATKSDLAAKAAALSPSVIRKLTADQENAFLSQKLAQIDTRVPLDFDIEQARVNEYDKALATEVFTHLGFRSLLKQLPNDRFETAIQESLF